MPTHTKKRGGGLDGSCDSSVFFNYKEKVTKDDEEHLKEFSWQKAKLVQSVIGVNDYFNIILFWSFIYFRSFEGFF